jgi:hypothetical protein
LRERAGHGADGNALREELRAAAGGSKRGRLGE